MLNQSVRFIDHLLIQLFRSRWLYVGFILFFFSFFFFPRVYGPRLRLGLYTCREKEEWSNFQPSWPCAWSGNPIYVIWPGTKAWCQHTSAKHIFSTWRQAVPGRNRVTTPSHSVRSRASQRPVILVYWVVYPPRGWVMLVRGQILSCSSWGIEGQTKDAGNIEVWLLAFNSMLPALLFLD